MGLNGAKIVVLTIPKIHLKNRKEMALSRNHMTLLHNIIHIGKKVVPIATEVRGNVCKIFFDFGMNFPFKGTLCNVL